MGKTAIRKALILVVTGLIGFTLPTHASDVTPETSQQRDARMAWWREAKFGLFVHWGLYSVSAGEFQGRQCEHIASWLQSVLEVTPEDYQQLMSGFTAEKYDPRSWARLAKAAGMKYTVITVKHHEGFCLYDSKLTDFKATNTPAKRDVIREFVDAFRAEGLKVGFYFSLIDWHHPDYPVKGDPYHPCRQKPEYLAQKRDMDKYLDYMHGQVREILTNYGPIDILWFDFSYDSMIGEAWRASKLMAMVRQLQPNIIVNNRLGGAGHGTDAAAWGGDFDTPEREIPDTGIAGRDWETCMTMNNTWGFKKHDHNWKSSERLIRNLVEAVSKGGNLLLNIGPMPNGIIPQPGVERLEAMGQWMAVNSESIYGTTASPFEKLAWGRCTVKPGKLYLHVFDWPTDGVLNVPGLKNKVSKAYLLADKAKTKADAPALKVESGPAGVAITLPKAAPDPVASVVVLEVEGQPKITHP